MPPKKITRKQLLKEPDEFITFSGKLIQVLNQYRNQIAGGLIAFFVLLAGIAGFRYYVHRSETQSSTQLAKIQTKYANLLEEGDALSAYQGTKSDMERLIDKHGNRGSGKFARILMGDFNYRAEQYEDALDSYEKALGSFPDDSVYTNRILSSLAYTYLAKNDTVQARKFFEKVAAGDSSLLADEVLFNLAILSSQGDTTQDGKAFWDKIAADHENSIFGEIARDKSGKSGKLEPSPS